MKLLRRILPLALAAVALALTLATHTVAIPPPPEGPPRTYPTEIPLSEPDYTSKRLRDFSPFAEALEGWPSGRRRYLNERLRLPEATVPELQQYMARG